MHIDEQHICPGDDALRGNVKNIENAVGRRGTDADRVRRIDTYRHPRQPMDYRHMAKINQVAMRIAKVGFHAAKTKDNLRIAFRRTVFRSHQGFIERDAKTALQ